MLDFDATDLERCLEQRAGESRRTWAPGANADALDGRHVALLFHNRRFAPARRSKSPCTNRRHVLVLQPDVALGAREPVGDVARNLDAGSMRSSTDVLAAALGEFATAAKHASSTR